MNKGCSYTAQGQFVCHVESAQAIKESFRGIEHFSNRDYFADADIKIDPRMLNKKTPPGLDAEFKDVKKACLMKKQSDKGKSIDACSLSCNNNIKTNNCTLNCSGCSIENVADANVNNYCMNSITSGPNKGGSACKAADVLQFTGRANTTTVNKKTVTDLETNEYIVYYNGKLYKNPQEANRAKRGDTVSASRTSGERIAGEMSLRRVFPMT